MKQWWMYVKSQLRARKGITAITLLTVLLSTSLVIFVANVQSTMKQTAEEGYGPFELVIGHDGSSTQLLLHTFFHLGSPTGNISEEMYESVQRHQGVDEAYGFTRGDSYQGYPLIGVDNGYFHTRYNDTSLKEGRMYEQTGEVVVGAYVAQVLQLEVGDTFHPSHGAHDDGHAHENLDFTVVGILSPMNTPDDKALWTTMDYAWVVHESDAKDVTAIAVVPKDLMQLQQIEQLYNTQEGVQAVYSGKGISTILSIVDRGQAMMTLFLFLALLVSMLSVLLALFALNAGRKKDIGLLRLIGKSRTFITSVVIGEGVMITTLGAVLGVIVGHSVLQLLQPYLFETISVYVEPFMLTAIDGLVVLGSIVVGILLSLVPAVQAYRKDPLTQYDE